MATLTSVLAQIRSNESGGNYTAQNPTSTASGAYQFVNGTWQNLTQQSGIGTQYATAGSAPPNIQDAVAAYALEQNPNANSSSLWGGGKTGYPLVDNYDVTSAQLASSGVSLGGGSTYTGNTSLASNATVDGGSNYYDPQTGTYDNGLSPYQNVDGTTSNPSITSNNTGALSGGYVSSDGSYVPPQAIPGVTPSTTASPVVASTTGAEAGSGVGTPLTLGLQAGIGQAINTWITGAETAVGNWMTKTLGDVFGSAVNWFARVGLIILGFILLAFALWRLLDPDGKKTAAVADYAAAAA